VFAGFGSATTPAEPHQTIKPVVVENINPIRHSTETRLQYISALAWRNASTAHHVGLRFDRVKLKTSSQTKAACVGIATGKSIHAQPLKRQNEEACRNRARTYHRRHGRLAVHHCSQSAAWVQQAVSLCIGVCHRDQTVKKKANVRVILQINQSSLQRHGFGKQASCVYHAAGSTLHTVLIFLEASFTSSV
jgi:hypothetical protein